MKKLLASVLLAAGMVSCAGTAEKTIPVYGLAGGRCGGYGSFHSGRLQQMEGTWPLRGVL